MPVGRGDELDEAERLKELGHLSAAVGHHVINAFAAVVSNAELIRSHAKSPNCDLNELAALGAAIIENALSASHVPRRLIDWTRRFTSPGFDQTADPVVLIDLNELIRETVELHGGRERRRTGMGPQPQPDPHDPGQCLADPFAPGLPDPERARGDAPGARAPSHSPPAWIRGTGSSWRSGIPVAA